MRKQSIIIIILFICLCHLSIQMSYSETLTVGADQQYKNLSDAILHAIGGDTIIVKDGEYKETVSHIKIEKPLTIQSENGPENTIITNFSKIEFGCDDTEFKGFTISCNVFEIDLYGNNLRIDNLKMQCNEFFLNAGGITNSKISNILFHGESWLIKFGGSHNNIITGSKGSFEIVLLFSNNNIINDNELVAIGNIDASNNNVFSSNHLKYSEMPIQYKHKNNIFVLNTFQELNAMELDRIKNTFFYLIKNNFFYLNNFSNNLTIFFEHPDYKKYLLYMHSPTPLHYRYLNHESNYLGNYFPGIDVEDVNNDGVNDNDNKNYPYALTKPINEYSLMLYWLDNDNQMSISTSFRQTSMIPISNKGNIWTYTDQKYKDIEVLPGLVTGQLMFQEPPKNTIIIEIGYFREDVFYARSHEVLKCNGVNQLFHFSFNTSGFKVSSEEKISIQLSTDDPEKVNLLTGRLRSFVSFPLNKHDDQKKNERDALIELYISTNGHNWKNNSNWLKPEGTECSWYGVSCNGNKKIRKIILDNNNLAGELPGSLDILKSLEELNFYKNNISGNITGNIGKLKNLVKLDLSENKFTGQIPTDLCNLINLEKLYLNNNELSGQIPSEISQLRSLKKLNLDLNNLAGPIPKSIGTMSNLEICSICCNDVSGSIPPEIGNLRNLQSLNLSGSYLSGSIPTELSKLESLDTLVLDCNFLSGDIPLQLFKLNSLKALELYNNKLSGVIPHEIGNLTNLRYFHAQSNRLSGEIPSELGKLVNLVKLDLSRNKLSGKIPETLSNLGQLINLKLGGNKLTGGIPSELQKLTNLKSLDLCCNFLSGNNFSIIEKFTLLEELILNSNQLTGMIPESIQNLKKLKNNKSNFRWNALHTNDDKTRLFVTQKQLNDDWENTQTIPPQDFSIKSITQNSVTLAWTPISYSIEKGGYIIKMATDKNGPYELVYTTENKSYKTFIVSGINPKKTSYFFRIQTVTEPHANNNNTVYSEYAEIATSPDESFLPHPEGVSVTSYDNYFDMSWKPIPDTYKLKHYAVYISKNDFSSVEGMTPDQFTQKNNVEFRDVKLNVRYYFAVTSISIDGKENPIVKTQSAIISDDKKDLEGPELKNIQIDNKAFNNSTIIKTSGVITLSANDTSGVAYIEFYIDQKKIGTSYQGTPKYSCLLDISFLEDKEYTLSIKGFDTLGNVSQSNIQFSVSLALPNPPIIIEPVDGLTTNKNRIKIKGTSEENTEILLYHNGKLTSQSFKLIHDVEFIFHYKLVEGANTFQLAAKNRKGIGNKSKTVNVTYDRLKPSSPTHLEAIPKANGIIRLEWFTPPGPSPKGYNIFRSTKTFTEKQDALLLNQSPIKATHFIDIPEHDDIFYYRVSLIDNHDQESELSNEASVEIDQYGPKAMSITYAPEGPYDEQSGRFGVGIVNIVLMVNELLQMMPYLCINPEYATPLPVILKKESDLKYSGFFVINKSTPSGIAHAVFSARDTAGNRGTDIQSGKSITIDTKGPSIKEIQLTPQDPIQNDNNHRVSVIIGLDEPMKSDVKPSLSFLLSGNNRKKIQIQTIKLISTQTNHSETWKAVFDLPSDAGKKQPENLQLFYKGIDDLDNESTQIICENTFQVYQGDLPPLKAPNHLKAKSLSNGKILITFKKVKNASGYIIYRKGPEEIELVEMLRIDKTEYTDSPQLDGSYDYAIATIRQENNQESISTKSKPVSVISDSTPPSPPYSLTLTLEGRGIIASWLHQNTDEEKITFNLYRLESSNDTDFNNLTPVFSKNPHKKGIDPYPSTDHRYYLVIAVDQAGNMSLPSEIMYLNVDLMPVSSIKVIQQDDHYPILSWSHKSPSIIGYKLLIDSTQVNQDLLIDQEYVDMGYINNIRKYSIIAVDDSQHQSLERNITLPSLSFQFNDEEFIQRGIMNRLDYVIENHSELPIEHARLIVQLNDVNHQSAVFSMTPNSTHTQSLALGGYIDLPDFATIVTTMELTPNIGESVEIIKTSDIKVIDGMMVAQLIIPELLRGDKSKIQFSLENTGEETIEIITANNSGNSFSTDISVMLMDQDDNILSTASYKQNIGESVITLPNGTTVARITPGQIFTSKSIPLDIPLNAPDNLIIKLNISNIYYHLGRDDQVTMDALSTRRQVSIVDTSYYGELISITPEISNGEDIVIKGRAIDRETGDAISRTNLSLMISAKGFERIFPVFTNQDGTFTYTYHPQPGEAGYYLVCILHPEIDYGKPQGHFAINQILVKPRTINLSIPRNYKQVISVEITAGEGSQMNNVRFEYVPDDQPSGYLPEGVEIVCGPAVKQLKSKESAELTCTIWADNNAYQQNKIILAVVSDELKQQSAKVTINAIFSEAFPALFSMPDHIETGVALDETTNEAIQLENKGTASLSDVELSLESMNGIPVPKWIVLNAEQDQGSIQVGEKRNISISFSPTLGRVAEGIYSLYLLVKSSNAEDHRIMIFVSVNQSGIGNVLFKITDLFTGTKDTDTGEIIQGLANAKIKIQKDSRNTGFTFYNKELKTDEFGEAMFKDLNSGSYKCIVTAYKHQQYIGRFKVKPGITVTKDVFLKYDLVTVEWEVVETTIEDKYDIVLNVEYETKVPAPVLIVDPPSIQVPDMKKGDVYNGEFTVTNYGLIAARDVQYIIPKDGKSLRLELLSTYLPDKIGPKERITVAYRVIALKSLNFESENETGGGCEIDFIELQIPYSFFCFIGYSSSGVSTFSITTPVIHCPLNIVIEIPGIDIGWRIPIPGILPPFDPPFIFLDICPIINCLPWDICCKKKYGDEGNSFVGFLNGEYTDDITDLSIKIIGGQLSINRHYFNNNWYFDQTDDKLDIELKPDPTNPDIIPIHRIRFKKQNPEGSIYAHKKEYWVFILDDGYRWENKDGSWKKYDSKGRLISRGDQNGLTLKYRYDCKKKNQLKTIEDSFGNQLVEFKYSSNQLSIIKDKSGRQVQYFYNGLKLSKVIDVLGREVTYQYNDNSQLESVIDYNGRKKIISYSDNGYVISVTDSNGIGKFFDYSYDPGLKEYYAKVEHSSGLIEEYWFDRNRNKIKEDINGITVDKIIVNGRNEIHIDNKGIETKYRYDEWNNLVKVIYPDKSQLKYVYDNNLKNKIKQEVNERGIVTEYEYDDNGNLMRIIEARGTPLEKSTFINHNKEEKRITITAPENTTTIIDYDEAGNIVRLTDPEDGIWNYTHDIMGNILTIENPLNKIWEYTYDSSGRLTSIKTPLDNLTRYEYDDAQKSMYIFDPYERRTIYNYDENSNLIQITHPDGSEELFEYGPTNRMLEKIIKDGKTLNIKEYDLFNREIRTSDGEGNLIQYQYFDSLGRSKPGLPSSLMKPVKIIFPTFSREYIFDSRDRIIKTKDFVNEGLSYSNTVRYDQSSNVISQTDKNGKITSYKYDVFDRLVEVTNPEDGITLYNYDTNNNLISVTNSMGKITQFQYNKNSHRTKIIRPMGQEIIFNYDDAGNLKEKIDSKGQKITYLYDPEGNIEYIKYFSQDDHETPQKIVYFTYDNMRRMSTYDDGKISAIYDYDKRGRKINETIDYGNFSLSYYYTYDDISGTRTFTGPDNITYTYEYDSNNRLKNIIIPGHGMVTINKYAWNGPETITYPGGTKKKYQYDPFARIDNINVQDPLENILMVYKYKYDPMSNIVQKITESDSFQYTYDTRNRLTGIESTLKGKIDIVYDKVGNRKEITGVEGQWEYNDNDQLLSYDNATFSYDKNGNRIIETKNGEIKTFVYNINNQLIQVKDKSKNIIAEYDYDPMGRRIMKKVGSDLTYYLYSDEGLIGEFDGNGQQKKSYGYNRGTSFSQNPVFMKKGENYYYYQNDHIATPQKMTEKNGNIVWEAQYESFGKAQEDDSSTIENNLRFSGQYYDEETGLHYNYAREYDTEAGRYIEFDPLLDEVHSPIFHEVQNENAYIYSGNRVTTQNDPPGTSVAFLVCSAGLPVCSAALVCSLNQGLCSAGLICSAQMGSGLCSGGVICSGQHTNVACSVGLICSGQMGHGVCSFSFSKCSAQSQGAYSLCSVSIGKCSAQSQGAYSLCSVSIGKCSLQGGLYGGSACSISKGDCSIQVGHGGSLCSVSSNGNCSLQIGLGYSKCSISKGDCSMQIDCSAKPGLCSGYNNNTCICFSGDTLVRKADGLKKIQSLNVGDMVFTMNEQKNIIEAKPILKLYKRTVQKTYIISFNEQNIECTDEHPFWITGVGWVPANKLNVGDFMLNSEGLAIEIDDIEVSNKTKEVYNIEVSENNNYFVSDQQLLVHNRCEIRFR